MKLRCRWRPSASATVLILVTVAGISAQVRYERGQDVVPVFEGWERNADGTINMVFGYMNRNYEEEVDIPVGPDNMIAPGLVDQGQPGHFYASSLIVQPSCSEINWLLLRSQLLILSSETRPSTICCSCCRDSGGIGYQSTRFRKSRGKSR
jgi:hypothetical protein